MTNDEIILLGKLSGLVESVLQRQDEQNKSIGKLFDGLAAVNACLEKLPCNELQNRLCKVENWQLDHNGAEKEVKQTEYIEQVKGKISLRNMAISAIITFFLGIIGTVLTLFFTGIITH